MSPNVSNEDNHKQWHTNFRKPLLKASCSVSSLDYKSMVSNPIQQTSKDHPGVDEFPRCFKSTVDGRNPAPPGMAETLQIMRSSSSLMVQDFDHQQYHLSCLRQHFEKLWKRLEQLHVWQDLQLCSTRREGRDDVCVCVYCVCINIYINLSILSYKRIISCLAGGFNPIEFSPNTNEYKKSRNHHLNMYITTQSTIIFAWKTRYLSFVMNFPNHGSGEHDPAKENERNSELFRCINPNKPNAKCFQKSVCRANSICI